jgi:FtsZ-binding cell division protein ZapB
MLVNTLTPPVIEPVLLKVNGIPVIKTAVAILGQWKRGEDQSVSFTQQDFDQMIGNFRNGAAGYNPPVYLGHPLVMGPITTGDTTTMSLTAAPRMGFIYDLFQEDEVLFAYVLLSPKHNPEDLVHDYAYSSLELARKAKDRQGNLIGTLVTALALTNEPFVPTFKENTLVHIDDYAQRFSCSLEDSDKRYFLFPLKTIDSSSSLLSNYIKGDTPLMSDESQVIQPSSTIDANLLLETHKKLIDALAEITTLKAELDQVKSDNVALSSQVQESHEKLSNSMQEIAEARKQDRLSSYADKINNLNVPAGIKDLHIQMFRSGNFTEDQLNGFYENLSAVSDLNKEVYTSPVSTQEDSPTVLQTPEETKANPYASIIERNLNQARLAAEAKGESFQPPSWYAK